MKYFLVEVKKAFGIYPMKAQVVMREKLVKGIFSKNVKVIREVEAEEMRTVVKYNVEPTEVEAKDEGGNGTPDIISLEDFQAMVQNRTLEQLEAFGEDLEKAVEILAEEDQEEGIVSINKAREEMEAFKEADLEGLDQATLLRIANGVYGLGKPKNTGIPKLTEAITVARENA